MYSMQAWKIPKQAAKPHSDFKSKHIDETFVNQTYDQNEPCCLQQGCTFTFNRSNLPSLIHTLPYPGEGGSSSLSFGSVPNLKLTKEVPHIVPHYFFIGNGKFKQLAKTQD